MPMIYDGKKITLLREERGLSPTNKAALLATAEALANSQKRGE